MNSLGALIAWNDHPALEQTVQSLQHHGGNIPIAAAVQGEMSFSSESVHRITVGGFWTGAALRDCLEWFHETGAEHLLVVNGPEAPVFDRHGLQRMTTCMNDTDAGIVYGDHWEIQPDGSLQLRQCIDYQPGSIRDTFRFGPVMLINGRHIEKMRRSTLASLTKRVFGALYDLRLRLSEYGPIYRLSEPCYRMIAPPDIAANSGHFSYVDPRNRDYQLEMETIATAHLKRIGAWITPPTPHPLKNEATSPVTASVVIPVKNRCRTIGDAVNSALSQEAGFPFNVIVIDNHSDDGTTEVLSSLAQQDSRLVHLIPERHDLLIGGCWNEAIYSVQCGKIAVQLDSDDIYDGTGVLARMVAEFDRQPYALVIGSYTTVNFDLKPLPPGLIDHREWTDGNGMNNALRIAGLGAPRAYHVPTIRKYGFPNVSYGEDYAVVLRLSRSHPVGRIYDSLYWCRRWDENSDSSLPPEIVNRYDHYKDSLRTMEIAARIRGKTNK